MGSPRSKGFCDLNIQAVNNEVPKNLVYKALELGYSTIAINQNTEDDDSKSMKKNAKFPKPIEWHLTDLEREQYCRRQQKPTFLSRVTVKMSNPDSPFVHKNKENMRKFDLVAVRPTTENAFKQVCQSNLEIDIISLDVLNMKFKPTAKLMKLAISKEIYFELCYGPCISDSITREKTIQLGYLITSSCKYDKIIITSGTADPFLLRGPHDVANLSFIFGLTQPSGKAAVCYACWDCVRCAETRKKCQRTVPQLSGKSKKRTYQQLLQSDAAMEALLKMS